MNTLSSESIKRGYRVVYALGNTDNILREVSDGVELVPINSKIPQAKGSRWQASWPDAMCNNLFGGLS